MDMYGVGDKVRYKTGGLTGTVINVLWSGKLYVGWVDGGYTIVCVSDIEKC